MATRAPLIRVAATSPARPARPKAAPTHTGPVRVPAPDPSWAGAAGAMAIGTAAVTPARSTLPSIDAMPRTAAPGVPPHATTVSLAVVGCTPATSNRSTNSTSGLGTS